MTTALPRALTCRRLLVALVAAVLSLPLTAPGPSAAVVANGTVPTRIGTYNIRAGVTTATFRAGVLAFTPRVDVAGLQEVNSHDKEAVLASLVGFGYWRSRPAEQTPVIWRSERYQLVLGRAAKLLPRTYIGREQPSRGRYLRPQYASVVRLQDLATGKNTSVINVHLIPGAVHAGRRWPGKKRLYAAYQAEMRRVAELVRAERAWGEVVALGDFNAAFVADQKWHRYWLPYATFRRLGMVSLWATEHPPVIGTHGNALIDQVFSRYAAVDARVLRAIRYSDHRPALGTYLL